MLRSFLHRRTHFAPVALRSDNCGESDGMRLGCFCGCALTDTLLWNGWLACCAASLLVFVRVLLASAGVAGA